VNVYLYVILSSRVAAGENKIRLKESLLRVSRQRERERERDMSL